jgi:hypothetical protein
MLEGRTRICQHLSLFANFNSKLARRLVFSQQQGYLSTNVAVLFLGCIRFVMACKTDGFAQNLHASKFEMDHDNLFCHSLCSLYIVIMAMHSLLSNS